MSNVQGAEVAPVTSSASYKWELTLYEERGTCWLRWSTNSPFRAQQGRVCLYPGSFPADPTQAQAWTWDNENNPFNTGKPWGAGWCAGYIAQRSPNGPYAYLIQTPVTKP
jgi:hypothetical protein